MVAGKSCVGSRKGRGLGVAGKYVLGAGRGIECGVGGENWGVVVWWLEGRRGGSKNIKHLVCLCVSKEILALTGVFFLPGMKQK